MYWYGVPDEETGFNLAMHIWKSRAYAIAERLQHTIAKRLAPSSYETFKIGRYVLRKRLGTRNILIEPYFDGDVGW